VRIDQAILARHGRLTVALSRAKRKMILVPFNLSTVPDGRRAVRQSPWWKNLLWAWWEKSGEGEIEGQRVQVWGCNVAQSEQLAGTSAARASNVVLRSPNLDLD
jgi:hypothetical protein